MTTSETPRLRRILFDRVRGSAFDRLNWATIDRAMVRLRGLGWTADDVASQILGDYGQDGDPAALIVARAKALDGPPPRQRTETPPPVQAVLAGIHRGHQPSTRTAQHVATIRTQIGGQTP